MIYPVLLALVGTLVCWYIYLDSQPDTVRDPLQKQGR